MGNDVCAPCLPEGVAPPFSLSSESEEVKAVKAGATFSRRSRSVLKRLSQILASSAGQKVFVQLSADGTSIVCTEPGEADAGSAAKGPAAAPEVIAIEKVCEVRAVADEDALQLLGAGEEVLLDIKAESRVQYLAWHAGLGEVLSQRGGAPGDGAEDGKLRGKTVAEKAAQAVHFQQRDLQLSAARKLADARKQKYMKESGGLKFTALAMAERK